MRDRSSIAVATWTTLTLATGVASCSAAHHGSGPGMPADDGGAAADVTEFEGSYDVPLGPTTTVALTGCAGPGYAAPFTVGSQTFLLTVDTGSGTLAVASNACPSCDVTPEYMPGPGATDDGQQVSDTYAAGTWTGEVYTDSVELTGTSVPATMAFAAIDAQSGFFQDGGCGLGTVPFAPQGIVGFGAAGLAVQGTDSFVTKLTQGGAVPGVFAVELCSVQGGGQLMLGGVDPAAGALTGPAFYTPMIPPYYGVELDDVQLGGVSLGFDAGTFGTAAVDTGTSVLALQPAVFYALVSAIEGTAAFTTAFTTKGWFGTPICYTSSLMPAQMDSQLPALTLALSDGDGGTNALTLKATESYLPATDANGTTYYCSGIYQTPSSVPSGTILGSSVMLGHMVIFDTGGQRIGFAPQSFCR